MNKKLRYYFENYRFNSLFFKNLYRLLLLIAVPIIGAMILGYYGYKNVQNTEIEKYGEKLCGELTLRLNEILQEAETQLVCFGMNNSVEFFVYDTELRQSAYNISTVKELLFIPQVVKDYVAGVGIYSEYTGYVIYGKDVVRYENWNGKAAFDTYMAQSVEPKENVLLTEWGNSTVRYLTVFSDINYGRDKKGVAVMNLEISGLLEVLAVPEGVAFCIEKDGTILLASENSLLGQGVDAISWEYDDRQIHFGKDYYGLGRTQLDVGLTAYVRIASQTYENQLSQIRLFIVLILISVIWITLSVTFFISKQLIKPIEVIMDEVKKYNSLLTDERDVFLGNNEIEYILHTFKKSMMARNRINMELEERIRHLKRAQAIALQAQIHPHFLNNVLDTVNWTAMEKLGSQNEISEIVGKLSKMLRMTLQSVDTVVQIRTEIEHCKYYLEIQEKRYEGKIRVIWDIEPEVLDCRIIRIVLQPLVENAIYHGIKLLSSNGRITIRGKIIGEQVSLTITDNGLGMSVETLRELQESLEDMAIREDAHIGLTNVNQRLKLYFGEEYGLRVKSQDGMGTEVTVCIPRS